MEYPKEELETNNRVDNDDEHDEQHDVEQGNQGHQDSVQNNL